MRTPATLAERESLDREIAAECAWENLPGCNIQAGLLTRGDYVASVRYELDPDTSAADFGRYVRPKLALSYRPPGHHEGVGTYKSGTELEAARAQHQAALALVVV